jgi:TrkA domain protein
VNIDVHSTVLPGIGVGKDIDLHDGNRIGVITRRTGQRELVMYDREDPDSAALTVRLTSDEADTIAELLGAPELVYRLSLLTRQAEGLVVEQIPVPASSPFKGRPLGDSQIRTRTGASIVAIMRKGAALPSPGPDFVLAPGDLVVIVGLQPAVDYAARILDPETDPNQSGADTGPPGPGR